MGGCGGRPVAARTVRRAAASWRGSRWWWKPAGGKARRCWTTSAPASSPGDSSKRPHSWCMIPPEPPVQVGFPTRRRHGSSRCPLPAALNRLPEPVLQQGNDPHSRVVVHPAPFLSLYRPIPTGSPMSAYGAELAAEAIQRGIVESISASQVNRLLREAELQPHRSRYWLNTTEKDPELFQAQVQTVCACYHDAPPLYFYHDTHTICVDEMTGIQALERIAPTLAMKPGQGERQESEYKRNGTLTLIGNFHVVTGELPAPTLGPTRTEADFAGHIDKTIQLDPEARYVFVVDNLNTHCSATLVELVARRCGIEDDLGQ